MTQHELPRVDTGLQTFFDLQKSSAMMAPNLSAIRQNVVQPLSGLSGPRHYDVPRGVIRAIIDAI
ncbi:hypothetical protein LPU83_pLPU83b_0251 (plasmid) [Rhizobium favelukesii]|uniref:Uncharacterized protein n=1 Tax=Rhizobium favelukesii TaxID=348824 RepID=W6RG98_9HYPH|nr:hypothetical protein LPU83_pLPU83b_0251 [Rhizobium favelukesii]